MSILYRNTRFVLLAALSLLVSCGREKRPVANWTVSLKKEGKNPYDTYLAFQSLSDYFPAATVHTLPAYYNFTRLNDIRYPGGEAGKSMMVLVGKSVCFSPNEWDTLMDFMRRGNEILLFASQIDPRIQEQFHFKQTAGNESSPLSRYNTGSSNVDVLGLVALPGQRFGFHGRDLKGYYTLEDKSQPYPEDSASIDPVDYGKPEIIGNLFEQEDHFSRPDFIQYTVGAGHLTLMATPLVLSNYFLLQPGNRTYADYLWQYVPGTVNHIYWGDFQYRAPDESGWSILWRHPATRWAIIVIIGTALIFLLFEMKRRQRAIPVVPELSNSSAAFVETVGMLYYNKHDNRNLAHKIDMHFADWIRTHVNLPTNLLNDQFALQLSMKSGVSLEEVRHLVSLLQELRLSEHVVSDEFLFDLYRSIRQFYQIN